MPPPPLPRYAAMPFILIFAMRYFDDAMLIFRSPRRYDALRYYFFAVTLAIC